MIKNTGIALLLIIAVWGCRKKVEWESNWVLPLFHHELKLDKLENDSTLVKDGGYYSVQLRRQLIDLNLSNFVSIPDTLIEYVKYLQLTNLQVPPGFEFMNTVQEHRLELQDLQLKNISLASGRIEFSLENPIETSIHIKLILPGVERNGTTLERDYVIGPKTASGNGKISSTIDLTNFRMNLKGIVGNAFNILQSKIIIRTSEAGDPILVTNQDGFVVKARFKDIKLNYAKGYFGNKTFRDIQDFDFDLMRIIQSGTVDLPSTQVKFNIENGIKVDVAAKLDALVSTGAVASVPMTGSVMGNTIHIQSATNSGGSLQPYRKSIVFNSSNSNVESFIANLGYKYNINYELKINPFGNLTGGWNEIFENKGIKVGLEVDMPLVIGLNQLVLQDTVPLNVEMTKDKTHVEDGELIIAFENAYPISIGLVLKFLDANNQLIGITNMNDFMPSSVTGTLFSNHLRYAKGELKIPMKSEIVQRISEVKKIVITAKVNTTDNLDGSYNSVQIPYGAFLRLKARAKFQLNTKF